jgi:hypothetical protein
VRIACGSQFASYTQLLHLARAFVEIEHARPPQNCYTGNR